MSAKSAPGSRVLKLMSLVRRQIPVAKHCSLLVLTHKLVVTYLDRVAAVDGWKSSKP